MFLPSRAQAEGAKRLAEGLGGQATLHVLNLSWNGLEDEGGVALGKVIAFNMGLRTLDLSATRVTASTCEALSEGLKVRASGNSKEEPVVPGLCVRVTISDLWELSPPSFTNRIVLTLISGAILPLLPACFC
jgi:hypothetical protein